MATVSAPPPGQDTQLNGAERRVTTPEPERAPMRASTLDWGNSAPLALLAFAVTTFILSMINANAVSIGVTPVVFGVALMFGGLAQLIAGVIQLRTGNTFSGVLFAGFGAFWLSFFAIGQWFLKDVPVLEVGHALGLFLYAFGIFVVVMLARSPHHFDPLGRLHRPRRPGVGLLPRAGRVVPVLLWPGRAPGMAAR